MSCWSFYSWPGGLVHRAGLSVWPGSRVRLAGLSVCGQVALFAVLVSLFGRVAVFVLGVSLWWPGGFGLPAGLVVAVGFGVVDVWLLLEVPPVSLLLYPNSKF